MVSSGQVTSDLGEVTSSFTNYKAAIENVHSSWQGSSYDNLNTKAEAFHSEYLSVVTQQMEAFAGAINDYNAYIAAKANLASALSAQEKGQSSDVSYYQSEVARLKQQIESELGSISQVLDSSGANVSITGTAVGNGEITFQTTRFANTTIWYTVIPKDKMPQLAVANDNYDKMTSEKPSSIAKRVGATLGINCCITGAGSGMLYTDGHLVSGNWTSGEGQTLYMTQDGRLEVVTNNRSSVNDVLSKNPVWATQGFYTIIRDGKYDQWNTDIAKARHPRTFIGQDYDGNYIVGVCTGRRDGEAGMTFQDIYDFVTTQVSDNVRILYNADGGGSSAFVYQGEKLNPNTDKTERSRPDLIYWT